MKFRLSVWSVFLMIVVGESLSYKLTEAMENNLFRQKSSHRADHGFSSALKCKETYESRDEGIECKFTLHNNGDNASFVSKWLTPLEGMASDCFIVKHNGTNIEYDGILMHRSYPPPLQSYIRIAGKRSVSAYFALSKSYSIKEPGEYTLSVNIPTLYYFSHDGSPENKSMVEVVSREISFTITETATMRQTTGEVERMTQTVAQANSSEQDLKPEQRLLDPEFSGAEATENRNNIITNVHRAVYNYANISALEVMEDETHFKTWFGTDLELRDAVRDNYNAFVEILQRKTITYVMFGRLCQAEWPNAYTTKSSNTIYLCPQLFKLQSIAPNKDLVSMLSVIMHELILSCVHGAEHRTHGKENCRELAKSDPREAIRNANNYELFSSTTYPFNFGIDVMIVFPNDKAYIVKDNIYARLDTHLDPFVLANPNVYPALIDGNWGSLPQDFKQGLDAVFRCSGNPMFTYATRGRNVIRYSDWNGVTIDPGFPKAIKDHFGASNLDEEFNDGFDAASRLPNGLTYITRGNRYARARVPSCEPYPIPARSFRLCFPQFFPPMALNCPNLACGKFDQETFPIAGSWGNTSEAFSHGFDSMMMTASRKTFVTKGKRYIRYSDDNGATVDQGYPKDIRGNFGVVKEA